MRDEGRASVGLSLILAIILFNCLLYVWQGYWSFSEVVAAVAQLCAIDFYLYFGKPLDA